MNKEKVAKRKLLLLDCKHFLGLDPHPPAPLSSRKEGVKKGDSYQAVLCLNIVKKE